MNIYLKTVGGNTTAYRGQSADTNLWYRLLRGMLFLVGTFLVLDVATRTLIIKSSERSENLSDTQLFVECVTMLGIAALMLLPFSLTLRPLLFWPRLALSIAVLVLFNWFFIDTVLVSRTEGVDSTRYLAAAIVAAIGVVLPVLLWWRCRSSK